MPSSFKKCLARSCSINIITDSLSFRVPHKKSVQQTAQYESLGRFSFPSGQCNFVVKNPLRNSPLYNYSLFGVILLNHAILKGLIHRECSMCSCLQSRDMCPCNYTPNGKKNVIEKYLPVTVELLRRLSVHGGSYTLITTVDTVNLFA